MPKIFWITCPNCLRRFYCHQGELRYTDWKLRCPFCASEFERETSPRIEDESGTQPGKKYPVPASPASNVQK
jgi:hypothetical protein